MKSLKYISVLLLTVAFAILNTSTGFAKANNLTYLTDFSKDNDSDWPASPEIFAEAAILMEADTGMILYHKNMNEAMYPTSITKLVTALLVLENCSLDEMVYFSENAVFSIPRNSSHIAMTPGEYLSIEDCLYGLLLASANEVANALAEHVSGSVEKFVTLMNSRSKELGAINTNFVNPSGLHDDNHYTTCYDIATICRTLIKNNTFLKINGSTSYFIPSTNLQPLERPVNTTHKLLKSGSLHYTGCFGGKTGYTDLAGNTLVTFVEQNGMTLICVVMKSDANNIYSDTTLLLNYGFSYFNKAEIAKEDSSFSFLDDRLSSLTVDSRLFNNPNPSICLNEGDFVYIPATISFDDLDYEIIPQNDSSVFANIIYTYRGHYIGETTLNIIEKPDHSLSPDKNAPEVELKIVNIKPIHIIIAATIIIVLILYIIYLKFTHTKRMRNKAIRRRKRQQRKRDKLH